jgi:hypothetical protein
MTTQQIDPAHVDQGQTTAGAPVPPPKDSGNAKPPGWDEQHGDPAAKEAAPAPKQPEAGKDTPAQEKAPDEAPKPKEPGGPLKDYVTLDNPHGQAAIEVLKESGVDPNEAESFFAKAIKTGDLADVDWASLEARVGKSKALLIKTGVENFHGAEKAKVDATVTTVHEIFNGAENWDKVRTWAHGKEKADAGFKKQVEDIRELLDMGGAKAAAGARELLRLYNSDSGTKGLQNGRLVVGDATGTVIGAPLSRADYIAELKKAHNTGASQTVIAQIDARRRAGKAQGL